MNSSRPVLVVVSRSTQLWGAETSLLTIARSLDAAGWEVRLLSRSPELVSTWPGPARLCPGRQLYVRAATAAAGRGRRVLVCGNLELAPLFGLLRVIPRRLRAALVLDLHDYLPTARGRRRAGLTSVCYDRVISVSEFAASQLPGWKKTRLVVTRPIDRVSPAGDSISDVDADVLAESPLVKTDPDRVRIGIVGRVDPDKNIELLVNAALEVPTAEVVVRGSAMADAAYADRLRTWAAETLPGRVRFEGRSPASQVMTGLDLLVVANVAEALGRTVAEAQRAGVPVLVPDRGGAMEMVEDGVTGVVYRHGDPHSLAVGIRRLIDEPEHARTVAEAAAEVAFDRHGPEKVAASYALFALTGARNVAPALGDAADRADRRVIIVSWYPAARPDSGERVRLHALASELGRCSQVIVLSFSDDRAPAPAPYTDLRSGVPVAYEYSRRSKLRAVASGRSVHEIVLSTREARRTLRQVLACYEPDVVVVNQLPPWSLVPRAWQGRTIVDTHNAEGPRLSRMLAETRGPMSWALSQQRLAAIRLERRIAKSAGSVWCVTVEDGAYFDDLGARSVVVPNGVRLPDRLWSRGISATNPIRLVFVGSLKYRANIEGLRWFRDVWMSGSPGEPDQGWTLDVVGSGDATVVRTIFQGVPGVTVVGRVDDVGDSYRDHDALLVPLRLGGGSRLKVLEALAHGIPIISSRVGVEGLDLVAGQHYLPADGPEEFGHALAALRSDPKLGAHVSAQGRDISRRFQWSTIGDRANEDVFELAARREG